MRWWPALLGLVAGYAAIRVGLNAAPAGPEHWHLAARWTARAAFPFLLIAYAAGPLFRVAPGAISRALVRQRRWWGLGFAIAHTAHLCALTNHFAALGQPMPAVAKFGGGAIFVLAYAMALTSFPAAQRILGLHWKRLHRIGIHALGLTFAVSYVGKALGGIDPLFTVPYAVLILGAMALRFAAWRKQRRA